MKNAGGLDNLKFIGDLIKDFSDVMREMSNQVR